MAKKKGKAAEPSVAQPQMSGGDFADRIRHKVAARAKAQNVVESVSMAEVARMPEHAKRVFLEELASLIDFDWNGMLNESRSVMSAAEAENYGNSPMRYGKYEGMKRKDIPEDYWDALEGDSLKMLQWRRAVSGRSGRSRTA